MSSTLSKTTPNDGGNRVGGSFSVISDVGIGAVAVVDIGSFRLSTKLPRRMSSLSNKFTVVTYFAGML